MPVELRGAASPGTLMVAVVALVTGSLPATKTGMTMVGVGVFTEGCALTAGAWGLHRAAGWY
jgi:hypothetical protein